jgi:hypothetical protein
MVVSMPIDYRESVLSFIRTRGPALPTQVGKHIGMDSMLAGALLSEMIEKKALKISHIKVGGSPLYFLPGQEADLLRFAQHLNEKEREAAQLLNQQQVLRDTQLPPPIRVALRQLQDFAIPLDVTFNEQKERFWKWFLLPDEEAKNGIRRMLEPPKPEQPKPERQEAAAPPVAQKSVTKAQPVAQQQKEQRPRPKPVTKAQSAPVQAPLSSFAGNAAQETSQQRGQQAPQSDTQAPTQERAVIAPPQADATDPFSVLLHAFFVKNNIKIVEQACVKKKAEYDFVLLLPSSVGELRYYCKAKAKKSVNEGDVSAAFVQGQIRKLPVLFLSPGELAKKAKELVSNELSALTYKRLEG